MHQVQTLRLFMLIAEVGSFSLAAQRLGIPRASASEAIARLEAGLGVKLLTRTTRSVRLTDEGGVYLDSCRRLIAQWDETHRPFAARQEPEGLVRVDMPERMAHLTVIPALPAFFARHPKVRLLVSGNARFIDLVQDDVDVAVRVGTLKDSQLVLRPAGALALVGVGSPAYLARHGTPQHPRDLAHHLAVGYGPSATVPTQAWDYVDGGQAGQVAMRSCVAVHSTESLVPCALAGLGLVQVPRLAIEAHLRDGDLVEVLPQHNPAPLAVSIVYTERRLLSARIRVVVDWLHQLLQHRLAAP